MNDYTTTKPAERNAGVSPAKPARRQNPATKRLWRGLPAAGYRLEHQRTSRSAQGIERARHGWKAQSLGSIQVQAPCLGQPLRERRTVAHQHHITPQQLARIALQAALAAGRKKPSAVNAAIASTIPATISRNSPARQSRHSVRQSKEKEETRFIAAPSHSRRIRTQKNWPVGGQFGGA
jgi:hypothetical protein